MSDEGYAGAWAGAGGTLSNCPGGGTLSRRAYLMTQET